MGDIEVPGRVRSLEWLSAESACREIVQSKIDCTDFRGGEDPGSIARVFAEDVAYTFTPTSRARGATVVGRDALAVHYAQSTDGLRKACFCHLLTNFQFRLVDPSHARARSLLVTWRFSRIHPTDRMIPGAIQENNDEFVLEGDGVWRLWRRFTLDIGRRPKPESAEI